jgi:4-hydroxy-3-methylbut-2-en-1-yl diphosphate reductase
MTKATYHRKGFGLKDQITRELTSDYHSNIITQLRENGNLLKTGRVTIRLANAFGFCWGVERAVSMAYETRQYFPERKIWITNEIIHNPLVNENLQRKNVSFVPLKSDGTKDFSTIAQNDVVILPAFGASEQELNTLTDLGCEIVDTTCPWVSRVWTRVAKYEKEEFTAIIHGKYNHEETIATASRTKRYLILENLAEAKFVCDYILSNHTSESFLSRFNQACSTGFDPKIHLQKVGVANQTTMLKTETEQIGKLFEQTMLAKYGPHKLNEHFISAGDTICDATQERQDAMYELIEPGLNCLLVIGGFNSSNTGHLQEIAESKNVPSYHIDGVERIGPGNTIRHKIKNSQELKQTENWLAPGEIVVGITAGASTPDQVIEQVIDKTCQLANSL